MRRNRWYPELGSGFDPGMDLILSLFSMFLLIGFFGTIFYTLVIEHLNFRLNLFTPQLVATIINKEDAPKYDLGSTEIPPDRRAELKFVVPTLIKRMIEEQRNTILIDGYASPEPMADKPYFERMRSYMEIDDPLSSLDANLDLSAYRAIEVAHFLKLQGIPYTCLVVRGFGRSRSDIIGNYGNEMKSDHNVHIIEDFDQTRSILNESSDTVYAFSYSDSLLERRIEISIKYDENSQCPVDALKILY